MKIYTLSLLLYLSFFSIIFNFSTEFFAQTTRDRNFLQKEWTPEQIWEAGLPYITHYTTEDYKAHIQNWGFVQDDNGIIYVGNTSGILQFDGTSWRLISLPNGSPAKSLAKSKDSIIYVGAVRDMGYLSPDSLGWMQYHTLLPQLDTAYHNFADIWFTFAVDEAIYFISDDYVFKWYKNAFKVWKAQNGYGFANLVNNQIYVESIGIGIMIIEDDSLKLIPDGDKFINEKGSVTTILPFENNKILMGHYTEGLFIYDNQKIVPFKKAGRNLLSGKKIYGGKILPNGDYVFVTFGNGCFIIDREGIIKQWLGKDRGSISDVILGGYVDKQGSLWLATESGINKIEISSPLRTFNEQNGLSEVVDRVLYHNNNFYACGKNGVFYLKETTSGLEKKDYSFQKINGINQMTWNIIAKNKSLLVAAYDGTYEITYDYNVKLLIPENTFDLLPSLLDSNLVFAGTVFGNVYSLRFQNKRWNIDKPKLSIQGRIYKMGEEPDGSLWLSTRYNGVYKVDFHSSNRSRSFSKDFSIAHYDTSHGLPEISYNTVSTINGEIYFSTSAGFFRFDSIQQRFFPDTLIMNRVKIPINSFENLIEESEDGEMWLITKLNFVNVVYKSENGVLNEIIGAKRFSDFDVYEIYDKNNIVFFCGPKGILSYNLQVEKNYSTLFSVNLRKVLTNNDSLLFAGHHFKQNSENILTLPFSNNSLRFVYSLPSYDKPELNQYQYYLEGFNENWSGWSKETQRDFTSLPEGDYIFHVKAKNIYEQVSKEAQFAFTIQPPWHRTSWAYLIYVFALSGIISLIVQWRSRRLKHEKEVLENIVKERTQQLADQTNLLAEQAEKLKEVDKQKSRFFANISHEFRTPLTLIKGPVENSLQSEESLSKEEKIMIQENTDRLLRLVNQLLDLSKIDTDNLELNIVDGDIYKFLRVVGSAFVSYAEQRNIKYHIKVPVEELHTMFDHDKLEKIMYNLLSNAFKFTPDDGEVILSTSVSEKSGEENIFTIEVIDTGIGISQESLPFIFDRFYQTDDSFTREHEGTGIGLSLTKELITLMKGDIKVESQQGEGSRFIVTLPAPSPTLSKEPHPQPFPEGEGSKGKFGWMTADPSLYDLLKEFAKKNKENPTKAELVLWELLRDKQLENYKFRRQHIIGKYIADFVCLSHKLVIEADGKIHQHPENKESDEIRTEWLKSNGYKVIRFTNEQVLSDPENVLKEISEHLVSPLGGDIEGAEEDLGGALILIVEDNADMRNFIKKQLEKDYRILEASHGKEGLKIAEKEIPDLIITDLMMPQMDGTELCNKLKTDEYTNHIPVIMLTAKAGQENKIEGLEKGADSYLTKPFDSNELRVRVRKLIEQRKQLREKFSREVILQPRNISITGVEEEFLKKVEDTIEQNLADEKFGVPQMQDALAMSKTQLHRKMKALTNHAPGEFLRNYRLQRAAQLLSQHGGNITEIAYAVGFGSLSYFTRSFKELYHQSPSEYAAQSSKSGKK